MTHYELGARFDLVQILQFGSLPVVFSYAAASEKRLYLETYGRTYLKEEIWNEQIVRKLEPFAHFLEVAAQCNGKILNFSKIGRDIGIDTKTVQSYYQILEDTFIGFLLPAWQKSFKRKPVSTAKFYFFDLGVRNTLAQITNINKKTSLFGDTLEHFIETPL